MPPSSPRGLPPRIYLPVVAIIALPFLALMLYLVMLGFGVTGSVFGSAVAPGVSRAAAPEQPSAATNVQGGGPPPAVMQKLQTLRADIAAHPRDDVALTELGDMYLAASMFAKAIPFYDRALRANPGNVAAQAGLSEARAGLAASNR